MRIRSLFSLIVIAFVSCVSTQEDKEIVSLVIFEQKQIVENHFDSEMQMCFKDEIGRENFSFTLYVETNDEREYEFSHDVRINALYSGVKSTDKCVTFNLRPYFNRKGSTEKDIQNLKSMAKGNIKTIRAVLWSKDFDRIIFEKIFHNL